MPAEHAIGIAGGVFFAICAVLLVVSVRRGRDLCQRFAEHHPVEYAAAGEPRPGYFNSVRRQTYFRFVLQRGFEDLSDQGLVRDFSELRRFELQQLVFMVAGFSGFGAAFLWITFAPAA